MFVRNPFLVTSGKQPNWRDKWFPLSLSLTISVSKLYRCFFLFFISISYFICLFLSLNISVAEIWLSVSFSDYLCLRTVCIGLFFWLLPSPYCIFLSLSLAISVSKLYPSVFFSDYLCLQTLSIRLFIWLSLPSLAIPVSELFVCLFLGLSLPPNVVCLPLSLAFSFSDIYLTVSFSDYPCSWSLSFITLSPSHNLFACLRIC